MKIAVAGTGYVGMSISTLLAQHNEVVDVDILSEKDIHLMILDIMMPQLDGIKTLMKLRESKNIPVILEP